MEGRVAPGKDIRFKFIKNTIILCPLVGLLWLFPGCRQKAHPDYPVKPIAFTAVQITDGFWLPRIETNRKVTIPFAFKKNEETGRVDNFAIAAGLKKGKYKGRRFNDTDVYKVIEGAAYSLHVHPDPELETYIDGLIDLIAQAQEEDGYLYAARTADPANPAPGAGPERWSRLRGSHELYNAGHLYEAAVAYYQATGKRKLLEISIKNADLLVRTFGPDKRRDFPGHQEVEIGLAKLYRVTGNQGYLELAKFFLDERGRKHDGGLYAEDTPFAIYNQKKYMQDHKPVLEQTEAVGHAVRAAYMYSGMADVAALLGSQEYITAINTIWENVVGKKLYLTGGIGARHTSEAFGDNYELPNASAYTETCAAVGNAFWNHRLFLLFGDAKYIDVLERVIYNGLISGVSLSGDRFFYQNPLESSGNYQRSPWFEVSCCPGNITRFLPSFPGYIYAQKEKTFYINLFVQSSVEAKIGKKKIHLLQETNYPWEGDIKITLYPEKPSEFTLAVRIPGWTQNRPVPSDLYRYLDQKPYGVKVRINSEEISSLEREKGFALITRTWNKGDIVEIILPMPVRRVLAHKQVVADSGRVAFERGPLVYCAEGIDKNGSVLNLAVPDDMTFEAEPQPHLLGGITLLKGTIPAAANAEKMKEQPPAAKHLILIPYYAWANRGPGEMAVWLQRDKREQN